MSCRNLFSVLFPFPETHVGGPLRVSTAHVRPTPLDKNTYGDLDRSPGVPTFPQKSPSRNEAPSFPSPCRRQRCLDTGRKSVCLPHVSKDVDEEELTGVELSDYGFPRVKPRRVKTRRCSTYKTSGLILTQTLGRTGAR